jgi:hypothetical protein
MEQDKINNKNIITNKNKMYKKENFEGIKKDNSRTIFTILILFIIADLLYSLLKN